jgi:hypothetical protein
MARSGAGGSVGARLLGLAALLLLGLGVALARLLRPDPVGIAPASDPAARLAGLDLARTADLASAHAARERERLGTALLPGDERNLAALLALQAESSALALGTIRFEARAAEGAVQPVALGLELEGQSFDLPIFLDGLFRQRHVVEVHSVALEARESAVGLGDVRVGARVEAWFFRPLCLPEAPLDQLLAPIGFAGPGLPFARAALRDAAFLAASEVFRLRSPALVAHSQANRRLVLRSMPRLVRALPGSPIAWVGATFEDGKAALTTERR